MCSWCFFRFSWWGGARRNDVLGSATKRCCCYIYHCSESLSRNSSAFFQRDSVCTYMFAVSLFLFLFSSTRLCFLFYKVGAGLFVLCLSHTKAVDGVCGRGTACRTFAVAFVLVHFFPGWKHIKTGCVDLLLMGSAYNPVSAISLVSDPMRTPRVHSSLFFFSVSVVAQGLKNLLRKLLNRGPFLRGRGADFRVFWHGVR